MSPVTRREDRGNEQVLYMAMELSKRTWKLGFGVGDRKCREVNVLSGDLTAMSDAIEKAKRRFGLEGEVRIRTCYEAGRDGFWIHRALTAQGIENVIVDPGSIEVSQRKRRAKNDGLDVKKLLKNLALYHESDRDVWSVVRMPSVEEEDERRVHRELERLTKERTGHRNRIQALLFGVGIRLKPTKQFLAELEALRLWDGNSVPRQLAAELRREYARLQQVETHIDELRKLFVERIQQPRNSGDEKAAQLTTLVSIGAQSGWVLSKELFAWRQFRNRREVASCVGLTPTPFDSGDSEREQGISKAGNRRVRTLLTQLAWSWLRYQPDSKLTRWFDERFGRSTKRSRRVGIIALARKLLIALWHYVAHGVIPDGARTRPLPS